MSPGEPGGGESARASAPAPRRRAGIAPPLVALGAMALGVLGAALFGADPDAQALDRSLASPTLEHLFGTDLKGRDLLARTLRGLWLSIEIAVLATGISIAVGVAVGALAGYVGGRLDRALMALVNVLYGLPFIAIVVVLVVWLGRNEATLMLAIGLTSWLTTARIVRAEVRSLAARPFVEAARALGAGDARILCRHVLPNLAGTIAVYAALTVPGAIRLEALLSFLGLGVAPPAASLGSLLREGLGALSPLVSTWWLLWFPVAVLVALVMALNALADRLRDRLDPRGRHDAR